MPQRRYQRREPTHDWQQIRLLLKDPVQLTYEIIRPVLLFGVTPTERADETGMARRTIYYKANLFDQAGMASLLPPAPPPLVAPLDRRSLPPPLRQAVVEVHAEYPALSLREIATICYARFGRRPSPHTIKLVLAAGPKPSQTQMVRRSPRFAEMPDARERRLAIIRLHMEGWNAKSIAGYLGTSRQTAHTTLRRWAEEQFAGLVDKSHTPHHPAHHPAHKITLRALHAVRQLQENPELGAYRVQAALEPLGIRLSRATCGRILALNRRLYQLPPPRAGGRPKQEMPFKAERRHQYWTVDIRYLDMHTLDKEPIYCISILENFSRAILASGLSRRQGLPAYLTILYAAIRKHGAREVLVSDSGGVFRAKQAQQIYQVLGIQKAQIQKRQAWQSYIETCFNVQRRMADWYFEQAQTWDDLVAAHAKWVQEYNYQRHFVAHEGRDDGRHSPAEVLGWVQGRQQEPEGVHRAFAAIYETRVLNKAGYARFRHFLLYGEYGLARQTAVVNIFQDTLTLEYGEWPLARYAVEFQPDHHHLLRVGDPRLYEHPYQSPQLPLWESSAIEWHLILRLDPSPPRRKRLGHAVALQAPLFLAENGALGGEEGAPIQPGGLKRVGSVDCIT